MTKNPSRLERPGLELPAPVSNPRKGRGKKAAATDNDPCKTRPNGSKREMPEPIAPSPLPNNPQQSHW